MNLIGETSDASVTSPQAPLATAVVVTPPPVAVVAVVVLPPIVAVVVVLSVPAQAASNSRIAIREAVQEIVRLVLVVLIGVPPVESPGRRKGCLPFSPFLFESRRDLRAPGFIRSDLRSAAQSP